MEKDSSGRMIGSPDGNMFASLLNPQGLLANLVFQL